MQYNTRVVPFAVLEGRVFQVCFPMDTNCPPLPDDLFLFPHGDDFIQELLKTEKKLAHSLNFTFQNTKSPIFK